MTARERARFFDRLYEMREAYGQLDAEDRAGITPIADAIAAAEGELEEIRADGEREPAADPATGTERPV